MKRSIKVLVFVLVIMMLVTSLAACKTTTKETEAKPTDKAVEEKPAEKPEEKPEETAELIWYTILPDQPGQDEVFDAMNAIFAEKLNANVDIKNLGGSYEDKVTASVASGETFDICFTSSWKFNYYNNVAKGAFLPLDDLLVNHGQNLLNILPPGFWDATKVEGKIYAVPNQQIAARSANFEWNIESAELVGINPRTDVKTLEDAENFMKAVYEANGKKTAGFEYSNYMIKEGYEEIVSGIPGAIEYANSELKVINQYKSDMYKGFIAMHKKWVDAGWMFDSEVTLSQEELTRVRKAGDNSCLWGGTYKPGGEAEMTARFGTPLGELQYSDAVLTTGGIIATMQAISVTSENPEKAMQVLDLVNSDADVYNLFAKGLEDRDYKKTGDNTIEILADTNMYNHGRDWAIGNVFNAYVLPGQPEDVWEQTNELNQNAEVSPLIGFAFNPEPVKDQIANCKSVSEEYEILIWGSVDIDKYYPEFVQKMDDAGADEIIAEMQKQIDAWLTTK